jgi:hypothetical protein
LHNTLKKNPPIPSWPMNTATIGCLIAVAVYCAGCGAAALATQAIPMAFQAATFTGVSVGSAVTGRNPTDDEQDLAERCDALESNPPYMGELVDNGAAVRGLILGAQGGTPTWFLSTTVTSMSALQFTPAIAAASSESGHKRNFLAYAADQPQNGRENNQLVAFLGSFEPGPGVLSIRGRNYRYAWVEKLPCFQAAK